MQILEAWCEELGQSMDIYTAQRAYFAQPEPCRRRFTFRCSDEACRLARNPLVSGVGYHQLAEEGEKFRQIHFRAPPGHPHLPTCRWVRDEDERTADAVNGDGARKERAKATNVIDVFAPRRAEAAPRRAGTGTAAAADADGGDGDDAGDAGRPRAARTGQTRTGLLEKFIDCWSQFEGDELKEQYVTIEGQRLSYRQAVTQVRWIGPDTNGRRIVYGGARIALWPAAQPKHVYLNFIDECEGLPEHEGSRKLTIHLTLAGIDDYAGRGLLTSRLAAGRSGKNYVRVFAWGAIEAVPGKPGYRMKLASLDNLVVKVIAKKVE
ncbi:hypothetical protein ACFFTM_08955 [Pseudoduganella plicata]|uniref:Uncharacterized protein n=1 Tax=Pseudoduganella plicata TaxID=321984 RepID=A0A4P7BA10_9BURK|nr:hypothetical protein [Pseudoduganella plicata]QBQ35396.1 hypothetical protein E1742_03865 [Pseudoduganella plicata]GGZ01397.1 hypothetical protein GCM10007388_38860 [Pseudoduganella plicata]